MLLENDAYALLLGSVALFAILAALMYLTRRVDWYAARLGVRPGRIAEPENAG